MNEDCIRKEFDVEEKCELESYDKLDNDQRELVDLIFDELEDTPCSHCRKNIIASLWEMAWQEGSDISLLSLSDGIRDLVINRQE